MRAPALLLFVLLAGVAAGRASADDNDSAVLTPTEFPAVENGNDGGSDGDNLQHIQNVGDTPTRDGDTAVSERLMHAFNLLGTRYQRRGSSPETGFDCSGFIGWVFRVADGVALPRTAHAMFMQQASAAAEVARDALAPGDLVFFRIGRLGKRIDHVGLYAGDGRFIHAPARGGAVRIDAMDLPYWRKHYAGARRLQRPATLSGDARHQESLSPAAHAAGVNPESAADVDGSGIVHVTRSTLE